MNKYEKIACWFIGISLVMVVFAVVFAAFAFARFTGGIGIVLLSAIGVYIVGLKDATRTGP